MNIIDQNKAAFYLNKALVPDSILIDGRTEEDRLGFLVNYATLINFYDINNTLSGDWAPFLLKDPIFLLAFISKTNIQKMRTLYLNTTLKLQYSVRKNESNEDNSNGLNQLLDQLTEAFMQIELWTYYMQKSEDIYDLKSYVIHEVKTDLSQYLWAILSLRERMHLSPLIKGIEPVKTYLFQNYDAEIWKESMNKIPYWKLLGLHKKFRKNKLKDIVEALLRVGNIVFTFLDQILDYSTIAYKNFKAKKSKFPDTILLRTFIKLLQVHQRQLNTISQKHLKFYYKDILKQTLKNAQPDTAFLCADLAKKNQTLQLMAGTFFNAGLDTKKSAIVFESTVNSNLNSAKVNAAYTLVKREMDDGHYGLFKEKITAPGVLKGEKDGKIKAWNTFGSLVGSKADEQVKLGVAFASPMLLLKEGKRTVQMDMVFKKSIDLTLFNRAKLYLSTQRKWLDVTELATAFDHGDLGISTTASFSLTLPPSTPGIAPFLKNPDGFKASWPLFKMEFTSFPDLADPPKFESLTVQTDVSEIKTFHLYNDYGVLSTKTPFQPLGPNPATNTSFIIGNAEIFSKPFYKLDITFNWKNLPKDFGAYYQQYNNYIAGEYNTLIKTPSRSFLDWLLHRKKTAPTLLDQTGPLNNTYFKVRFQLLQEGDWVDFYMDNSNDMPLIPIAPDKGSFPVEPITIPGTRPTENLFTTSGGILEDTSSFGYPPNQGLQNIIIPCPQLQNAPLKYNGDATFGFIRMLLSDDEMLGFGEKTYPKVVSAIALYNAMIIFDHQTKPVSAPNKPFTPKTSLFTANYSAAVTYNFDKGKKDYPLKCFYYTPFQKYLAYDRSSESNIDIPNVSICDELEEMDGFPLFPSFGHEGTLFLQMEDVAVPGELNLYFQMSQKYAANTSTTDGDINYRYLSQDTWKELHVVKDGTKGFRCPGIVKFSIPTDMSTTHTLMPTQYCWVAIGVKDNPDGYAQTAFLANNGFMVKRSGSNFLKNGMAPHIKSNIITEPKLSIPQISKLVQPFPSFGGKAAEDVSEFNKRVSTRLKTKDRLVSTEDFFRTVRQAFKDIYYAKLWYASPGKPELFLVKQVENTMLPNAFMPLVDSCMKQEIEQYLNDRTSSFSQIRISNFLPEYVSIKVEIVIGSAYGIEDMEKTINEALNIFISPWIASDDQQVQVDVGIKAIDVAACIKKIPGVVNVRQLVLQSWIDMMVQGPIIFQESEQYLTTEAPNGLFVSAMKHNLTILIE